MEGHEHEARFTGGELGRVSDAFVIAFKQKCHEVFGTAAGITFMLNGQPPVARIRREQPTGDLLSPEEWQQSAVIATEILNSYELDDSNLEATIEIDPHDGPTIIIRHKEN
jgi:hypothetical protein